MKRFLISLAALLMLMPCSILAHQNWMKTMGALKPVHPSCKAKVDYLADPIADPNKTVSKKKYWGFLQDYLDLTPYFYGISGRKWNDISRLTAQLNAEHGNDVDANWDEAIGREGIARLTDYAKQKGVRLTLWYNSNGYWNDAPQTPRNIMSNAIARKRKMAWMECIGIAGIKVDFFSGDKQETMQLYENILSDANDHHLAVIFHGCTLPRGWERMYPNYIASKAALANENVYFDKYHAMSEGFEITMHPFCRNAVGRFDRGGVILNRYLSRDNRSRHQRYTSNVFELATVITNQTSINCVAVTPQADSTINATERSFLKRFPTTWKDTKFITDYSTCYVIIARQDAVSGKWYIGGLNGTDKPLHLSLQLSMFANKCATLLTDGKQREAIQSEVKIEKDGRLKVSLQPMGGIVLRAH